TYTPPPHPAATARRPPSRTAANALGTYASALGRFLKSAYQRWTFLNDGSSSTPAKAANSRAASSVQSAMLGRLPATKGLLPINLSSTPRLGARRGRGLYAASGAVL